MKNLFVLSLLAVLLSCNTNKNQTEVVNKIETEQAEPVKVEQPAITEDKQSNSYPNTFDEYGKLDSLIKSDIENLDSTYTSTPFYSIINGNNYYVVCTGKWNYKIKRFSGQLKYGLANDSLDIILEAKYDKIYNPNLTLMGCTEVKSGSKIGLFNFELNQVLEPQFDYILPASSNQPEVAYGNDNGTWYEINSKAIDQIKLLETAPTLSFQHLSFDVDNVGESMMFDSYFIQYEDDAVTGRGVIVIPSYLEYLKVFSQEIYADVIMPDQSTSFDFGTEAVRAKIGREKPLYDKIKAFFVSAYEEGIDARGYSIDSKDLIVYNTENNKMNSVKLGKLYQNDYFCRDAAYHFVNDSILEVKSTKSGGYKYNFETFYTYYKVTDQGEILPLESNRHFDFTKYIMIDEKYFKGCYAYTMEKQTDRYNMYQLAHLTIDDLDVMRNEIFAEYGYVFKTEKWKNYFASQSWYRPRYENVDDKLTAFDKANIEIILKVKESMIGNEEAVIQKSKTAYVAAG